MIKKLGIMMTIVTMLVVLLVPAPASAASVWTSYGKEGMIPSDEVGGFTSPVRIDVDAQGNVYVTDQSNTRIQRQDAATGEWELWQQFDGSDSDQPSSVDYIKVAANGHAYIADASIMLGRSFIYKLNNVTNSWEKISDPFTDMSPGQFLEARAVEVDSQGNLYAVDSRLSVIQVYSVATGTWSYLNDVILNRPSDIAIDASDNLYIADTGANQIKRYDAEDDEWTVWGNSNGNYGTIPGEFSSPFGIEVDAAGQNVYVADTGNNRIQRLDVSTSTWTVIADQGSNVGQVKFSWGIALDESNNYLYVADQDNSRVQRLDLTSNTWRQFGTLGHAYGNEQGEFSRPRSLAIDSNRNVYVADTTNHRIQLFNASTEEWSTFAGGSYGTASGQFTGPSDIAIDDEDNIYVVEEGNQRIQKYTQQTGVWTIWATGAESFTYPKGIAVDGDGNIYVADTGNHRIQILDQSTETWTIVGGQGSGLGQFSSPTDVVVDPDGLLYVSDTNNNRLQVYDSELEEWSTLGRQGTERGEFNAPTWINYRQGSLMVADTGNHRVQLRNPDNSWTPLGSFGVGEAQFNQPGGFDYDGVGTIFFTDTLNNRVVKLKLTNDPVDQFTLSAEAIREGVKLSWTEVEGAQSYHIYMRTATSSYDEELAHTAADVLTYTASGLAAGQQYYFTVIANDEQSNEVSAIPLGRATSNPTPTVPIEEDKPESTIFVNGKAQLAGETKAEVVNGQATTIFTVNGEKLRGVVADMQSGVNITIPLQAKSDSFVVVLDGLTISQLEEKAAQIEIVTPVGTYQLPVQPIALEQLANKLQGENSLQNVSIKFEISLSNQEQKASFEHAATVVKFEIIGQPTQFTVQASLNEQTIDLLDYNRYVQHFIPLPEGIDYSKITTGVVINSDGTVRHVPTKVVVLNDAYYAQIHSLATGAFGVIWNPLQFSDLAGHWSQEEVNDMGARLVVEGNELGHYNANEGITRAEFTAVLVRALGLQPLASADTFTDVSNDEWYSRYIETAYSNNLIQGTNEQNFDPNAIITREQVMVIMERAMHLTGLADQLNITVTELAFIDGGELSSWALNAAISNLNAGIVIGRDNIQLAPGESITRAEATVMLQRLLAKSNFI